MWLGIKESTYGYADLWSPLIDFTDYNRIVITGIQRFNNTNSSRYAIYGLMIQLQIIEY